MIQNEEQELFEIGSRVVWINKCHTNLSKSKISRGEIVDKIIDGLAPLCKDDGKFLIKDINDLSLERNEKL